eukprot:Selendium_serpulae@DN5680_c0_g1_i1.p1
MEFGYAVLTDKASGEILSSICWGQYNIDPHMRPPAFVELMIKGVAVTVYPLPVFHDNYLTINVQALNMENKAPGLWYGSMTSSLGGPNEYQSFVDPPKFTTTTTTTRAFGPEDTTAAPDAPVEGETTVQGEVGETSSTTTSTTTTGCACASTCIVSGSHKCGVSLSLL